jgi:dolichol-phosphate mannosyltransferase
MDLILLPILKRKPCLRIERCNEPQSERVSILLPVLNEAERIDQCLNGLVAQSEEVAEILVVDGGSTDGTQSRVRRYERTEPRVRLLDASPVEKHWTGKAWGLNFGLLNSNSESQWILCIDADVSVSACLTRSLLAHAQRTGISSFSVATQQRLSGLMDGLIHPALLTTLVYRFGVPGRATRNLHNVQANGQCFLSRRATLVPTEAFRAAQSSLCEDITAARRLAECGEAVGFYEANGLVETSMYRNWRETWRNWPRSLAMRDRYFGWREAIGLLGILLFQALPLPMFIVGWVMRAPTLFLIVTALLVLIRLGVLAGVARAYVNRPWTYWLSPFCDLPVAFRLMQSALARRHSWRGRAYLRGKGGKFELLGH